jgi:hypothetical protein
MSLAGSSRRARDPCHRGIDWHDREAPRHVGVASTAESRRAWRNLLLTTPGVEARIGGVILYDETIRQAADDGTRFPTPLADRGMIPRIKVDCGAGPLASGAGVEEPAPSSARSPWQPWPAVLLVAGCEAPASSTDGRPLIAATTTRPHIAATRLGMPTGADPHDFEPSPHQAASLCPADLVSWPAVGLESGLAGAIEGAGEAR